MTKIPLNREQDARSTSLAGRRCGGVCTFALLRFLFYEPWGIKRERVAFYMKTFVKALKEHLAGEVYDDPWQRGLYATDASPYEIMPMAVVVPKHRADVCAAVHCAREYGVPILPRGGGTSLAGQAVNDALIIDMTRHLDQVVEVNEEERWVRVQPGVVLDEHDGDACTAERCDEILGCAHDPIPDCEPPTSVPAIQHPWILIITMAFTMIGAGVARRRRR